MCMTNILADYIIYCKHLLMHRPDIYDGKKQ